MYRVIFSLNLKLGRDQAVASTGRCPRSDQPRLSLRIPKRVYCDNGSAAFRSKPVNPVADRNGAIRCRKKNPPGVNRWPVSSVRIAAALVSLKGHMKIRG